MKEKNELLLLEKKKYNLPSFISDKEKRLLKNNVPIQHIIGFVDYTDVKIKVNKNVLIPRYETDELIYLIAKDIKKDDIDILDLCTGSGFIGLSLKRKKPKAKILMTDISQKALKIARYNRKINFKFDKNLSIKKSNLFENVKGTFDLIVSNPPYLSKDDSTVDASVIEHEPKIALYAKNKGWQIYEKILSQYNKFLKPNGTLYLEINPYHYEKWTKIKNVEIIEDINGKPRFIKIVKRI
ncbi:peptide chain release factor N(5)-glutamine methyltransferase [Mycoplasmopsis columbina]|uniref:peptide chain release factor N(5)-glutamine methyltransferase n=1 Tax=Mycoplasmopsis columbina TaxID=114881 RepID=UPI0004A74A15|nr:peptide chain release factor N(5)-glutamine methyltransferase [Mycoplasmopsis columbina]VEU77174.1 protoporphyrinogen oxidase [Mycoplasmopsis columbina]